MTRNYALLAVAAILTACAHAKASPVPPEPSGHPPPAYVAPRADVAPAPFQALRAVQKAAPVIAAVAGESLASAPKVALAAATGGPIAGIWAWVTNNPTAVGGAALGLVALVFLIFGSRLRLKPQHSAMLAQFGPPLIEQAKKAAAATATPWDDVAAKVVEDVARRLIAEGAPKPAAINAAKALVAEHAPTPA